MTKIFITKIGHQIITNEFNFITRTRKNCFRYLKLMSPLNAAICTTISLHYELNDTVCTI
jgi:hypothetical protein